MPKLPIQEIKQILEQKIDFNCPATKAAMIKLGLSQRSLQRVSYLEYMTTNLTSQQDYFLYLHAIAVNVRKLQQEIAKMNLQDKSIDCTEPGNIDEIIALLDKRMNKQCRNSQPRIVTYREKTQEKEESSLLPKQRIIRVNNFGLKSITERALLPQPSPPKLQQQECSSISLSPDRLIHKKMVISNNQSVAELCQKGQASIDASTIEQLNESMRKNIPDKNIVIMTGIKHRLKDSNCSQEAIAEFMKKIAKLRSLSQQSIDSGRKLPNPITIKPTKKFPNIIQSKLELMLKKEKLIREEPLKIHQMKIGNIMGVISKIRNQKSKQKMFQQVNNNS